ncbi:hypothetical protein HDV00_002837 [Rhizophlyctis rosea]|nr:hypothetical protein HDV00_002837 [Rhizophlyctis rosea]
MFLLNLEALMVLNISSIRLNQTITKKVDELRDECRDRYTQILAQVDDQISAEARRSRDLFSQLQEAVNAYEMAVEKHLVVTQVELMGRVRQSRRAGEGDGMREREHARRGDVEEEADDHGEVRRRMEMEEYGRYHVKDVYPYLFHARQEQRGSSFERGEEGDGAGETRARSAMAENPHETHHEEDEDRYHTSSSSSATRVPLATPKPTPDRSARSSPNLSSTTNPSKNLFNTTLRSSTPTEPHHTPVQTARAHVTTLHTSLLHSHATLSRFQSRKRYIRAHCTRAISHLDTLEASLLHTTQAHEQSLIAALDAVVANLDAGGVGAGVEVDHEVVGGEGWEEFEREVRGGSAGLIVPRTEGLLGGGVGGKKRKRGMERCGGGGPFVVTGGYSYEYSDDEEEELTPHHPFQNAGNVPFATQPSTFNRITRRLKRMRTTATSFLVGAGFVVVAGLAIPLGRAVVENIVGQVTREGMVCCGW